MTTLTRACSMLDVPSGLADVIASQQVTAFDEKRRALQRLINSPLETLKPDVGCVSDLANPGTGASEPQ